MESQSNAQGVVSLSGARLPADRGLSSLGLLMQLAGSLSMTSMVLITLMPIFAGGAAGHGTLFLFLMGASGVVRGAFHRAAGNALIYGSVDPKKSVLTYIGVSVVETLVWALIMIKGMNATFTATLPVFSLFLAWPLVLAIVVHHPRYQAVFSQNPLPQGEDQGFEGTGVYMLILGVIGALFSGLMVLLFAKAIFKGASEPAVLMITGVFVMLTIRSVMHTNAGIKSLKGVGAETASDAAAKYYSFGIVSSIIAAAAVLVLMMMTGLHPVGLLMVGLVLGLLLIWPLTLRRFYTERNFGMFLAGNEAPVHRRAPDGGLTALGWLLLGGAAIALGSALPDLFGQGSGGNFLGQIFGGGSRGYDEPAAAAVSHWWGIGIALVQLWAGIELITMSDRYRIAGTVYGAVAAAISFYLVWPQLKAAMNDLGSVMGSGGPLGGMPGLASQGYVAMTLVIPIMTIVLVNRNLVATATARVRQ